MEKRLREMQRQMERDNGGRVRTATNLYRNLCVNYEKIPLPGALSPPQLNAFVQ